jgi:hypothetical protein
MNPHLRRSVAGVLLAMGTVVAAVVALPGVALATVVIPSNITNPLLPPGSGGRAVRTASHYWSVLAMRSAPGQDFDLTLTTPTDTVGSSEGENNTDFVAINSNYQPLGTFPININHYSGPDSGATFDYEFVDTAQVFAPTKFGATTGSPGSSGDQVDYDPAITRGPDVAKVFDVQLVAGQYYVIKSIYDFAKDANVFLLSSDPAKPATWVRSRSSALHVQTGSGVSCTRIRAARSDWYGLVILFDNGAGGYHSWEGYDIEKASADDGKNCTQAGSF